MSDDDKNLINPNPQGAGDPPAGDPPAGDPPAEDKKDFAKDWKEFIPEDLKDRAEWGNIKEASDLFKNYISAQQMISKSVRLPEEGASAEEIAKFYTKLGKPADMKDYTFEYTPKENYVYKKDSFDFEPFKAIADKANLTAGQYQAMAQAYLDFQNENYLNYNKALEAKASDELKKAEGELRSEWGTEYNQNINAITDKIKKLYPAETMTRMQNAGLFRDPAFLKSHLKLTKMMTGDTVFIEGNAVENVPQTLQTLQDKRDKLMSEDYAKNRDQVLALNQQIVKLKQAQSGGAARFQG